MKINKMIIAGLVCAVFLTACEDTAENSPNETGSSISETVSENVVSSAETQSSPAIESTMLTESSSARSESTQSAVETEVTTLTESVIEADDTNGNTLFEDILQQTDMLRFFTLDDGEAIRFAETRNTSVAKEVFDFAAAVSAEKTNDWSASKMTFPVYGFYAYDDANRVTFSAAWSNGFLVTSDGTAYRFDCDFSTVETGYDWDGYGYYGNGHVSDMPCGYFFSFDENGWIKENISKRLPFIPVQAPEDVTVEYQSFDNGGGLSVLMTNNRTTDFYFLDIFHTEVLLDGEWYDIPTMKGSLPYSEERLKLPAETSNLMIFPLETYGDLPSGNYRVVGDGFYVEFTV